MKISVIVPCFNGGPYLKNCLESVLSQDYEDYEVIFVDNESTDGSVNVAKKVLKTADRDMLISSAPNLYRHAWCEPVGEGMRMMTGEYFTIIGADDFVSPSYLSNAVAAIESFDDDVVCMQSVLSRFYNEGTDMVGYSYDSVEEMKRQLLQHCAVNTPTVFYRKDLYEDGHMTWNSETYLGAADYDLYCQFADKNIMIHSFNTWLGYVYRLHQDQSTWGMVAESQQGGNFDSKIKSYWKGKWKS